MLSSQRLWPRSWSCCVGFILSLWEKNRQNGVKSDWPSCCGVLLIVALGFEQIPREPPLLRVDVLLAPCSLRSTCSGYRCVIDEAARCVR